MGSLERAISALTAGESRDVCVRASDRKTADGQAQPQLISICALEVRPFRDGRNSSLRLTHQVPGAAAARATARRSPA